jgi:hypothetical protein
MTACLRHSLDLALSLAGESIVFGMRANPEPRHIGFVPHGQSPVVQANPHGPKTAHFLEM